MFLPCFSPCFFQFKGGFPKTIMLAFLENDFTKFIHVTITNIFGQFFLPKNPIIFAFIPVCQKVRGCNGLGFKTLKSKHVLTKKKSKSEIKALAPFHHLSILSHCSCQFYFLKRKRPQGSRANRSPGLCLNAYPPCWHFYFERLH